MGDEWENKSDKRLINAPAYLSVEWRERDLIIDVNTQLTKKGNYINEIIQVNSWINE